jgi:DNA damage-binding protein 1
LLIASIASVLQELGLLPEDADESPAKNGLVMFCSFAAFGLVPLLGILSFLRVPCPLVLRS